MVISTHDEDVWVGKSHAVHLRRNAWIEICVYDGCRTYESNVLYSKTGRKYVVWPQTSLIQESAVPTDLRFYQHSSLKEILSTRTYQASKNFNFIFNKIKYIIYFQLYFFILIL